MTQKTQPIRTRLVTALMAGVASIGFATAATAAGVGVGVNAGAGAQAGGAAAAQMSTSGSANSNAQWQSGATRGGDRAAERLDAEGAGMTQSTDAELEATGKASVKGAR